MASGSESGSPLALLREHRDAVQKAAVPTVKRRANEMVERQLAARGIDDVRVLEAMRRIPRQAFVPRRLRAEAYCDSPLPIGAGQTISQPYVVALMITAARVGPADRVLDVGVGSGYTAAVLSLLAGQVFGIERHRVLVDAARACLTRLGRRNVELRWADGSIGWPEAAPFDAILVGASGPEIPPALCNQLAPGGRLVMPVGRSTWSQHLVQLTRTGDGTFREEDLGAVSFVPLIGAQGWPEAGDGDSFTG
jgi:protein-L-isoaspartate(D-aspartate) O-methyltransferase